MKPIISKVIAIAKAEVGVREEGDNMGARVNEYQHADTLSGVGYAWCGSFLSWCLKQATDDIPYCYSASCDVILAWAKSQGVLHDEPEIGNFFLVLARGSRYDATHTGLITKVDGPVFHTVEGNTNLTGSRTGIGVFALKRTVGDRYKFVRWADLYLKDEAVAPPYRVFVGDKEVESRMVGAQTFVPVREWGETLGLTVQWNAEKQVPLFNGREVGVQIAKLDRHGWAWVRALAEFSGLKLQLDNAKREVRVHQTKDP